ncbi:MAG: hypothetical protein ACD_75C01365G0001 [uncultured bacterium]|nr:MAG: hypothetical protein ACD_75C01365G0001 [uncultured bacterium]
MGEMLALSGDIEMFVAKSHGLWHQGLSQIVITKAVHWRGILQLIAPVVHQGDPARLDDFVEFFQTLRRWRSPGGITLPQDIEQFHVGIGGHIDHLPRRQFQGIGNIVFGEHIDFQLTVDMQVAIEQGLRQEEAATLLVEDLHIDKAAVIAAEIGHDPAHLLGAVQTESVSGDGILNGSFRSAALVRSQGDLIIETIAHDFNDISFAGLGYSHNRRIDKGDL